MVQAYTCRHVLRLCLSQTVVLHSSPVWPLVSVTGTRFTSPTWLWLGCDGTPPANSYAKTYLIFLKLTYFVFGFLFLLALREVSRS